MIPVTAPKISIQLFDNQSDIIPVILKSKAEPYQEINAGLREKICPGIFNAIFIPVPSISIAFVHGVEDIINKYLKLSFSDLFNLRFKVNSEITCKIWIEHSAFAHGIVKILFPYILADKMKTDSFR